MMQIVGGRRFRFHSWIAVPQDHPKQVFSLTLRLVQRTAGSHTREGHTDRGVRDLVGGGRQ